MTTEPNAAGNPAKPTRGYVFGGAAAACAVCCAPPVLALVGIAGGGALATGATLAFAGLAFAVVVAVISVAAFIIRKRTPRRTNNLWHKPHATSRPGAQGGSSHGPGPLPDPVRRSSSR
jgi:hypothetical protein